MAGAGLAIDGLRRGGYTGMAETTAGGAMIGYEFGGPLGAAIGAVVGLEAGIVRMFIKGAAEKAKEKIKSLQFGSGNAKIEQRFLLGNGAKRFTVRRQWLRDSDRVALRNFWESKYGPFGAFTYNAPNDDGNGTTAYTCRFVNEPLSWDRSRIGCARLASR
jgi:hypothetical protein